LVAQAVDAHLLTPDEQALPLKWLRRARI